MMMDEPRLTVTRYRCRKCSALLFESDAPTVLAQLVAIVGSAAPDSLQRARWLARSADVETICPNRRCRHKQRIALIPADLASVLE